MTGGREGPNAVKETERLPGKVPLSVLVPIKNEAQNLARCLQSVSWADELFVVDSQSVDGSQAIAEAYGAKVVQFEFSGSGPKKKNWALSNLSFRHDWLLILDADEVLAADARHEIAALLTESPALAQSEPIVGYWINRRFQFMGKWLRHAYFPNWNLRLFKHKLGRYENLTTGDTASGDNEVHEHILITGRTGYLKTIMDHYAFPTIDAFIEKHNRYSNWEARVELDCHTDSSMTLSAMPFVAFRRKMRLWSRKMPGRPLLRFLYVYLWQKGFLDGIEGYFFSLLHAFYELMIVAKIYELKKYNQGKSK